MNTTKRYQPPLGRQSGMTLVEIMIALGISVVLLAGVLQIFQSSKQSYRLLEANSRVQENGRFAINFVTDDLRMAGYRGCYTGTAANIESLLTPPAVYSWDFATPLQGNEWNGGGWTPALDPLINGQVLKNTDVFVTRGLASNGIGLVAPYSDSAQLFVDPATNNIVNGDILMVTDCNQASIFQVTNQQLAGGKINIVHSNAGGFVPGNNGTQLVYSYGADAQVARLQTNIYYIGTGASGAPALFRQSLISNGALVAQELAEDVENLQVLYGEDTNNDGIANRYVTANNVGAMANVASVRVSLLVRSTDNIATTPQSYSYNGATTVPADLRIRRVFTTTVKLRNLGTR